MAGEDRYWSEGTNQSESILIYRNIQYLILKSHIADCRGGVSCATVGVFSEESHWLACTSTLEEEAEQTDNYRRPGRLD